MSSSAREALPGTLLTARQAGSRERGDPARALLAFGLPLVAIAFLATVLDIGGMAGVWENVHWTVASGLGFALALTPLRRPADRTPVTIALAAGIGSFFFGQLVWVLQVAVGHFTVPAPSDVLFLFTAIPIALAFGLAARERVRGAEEVAMYLDAATVFLAVAAVIEALLHGAAAPLDPLAALTLFAYPVLFLATAGAGLVVVLALGVRPSPRGMWLTLGSFALLGVSWVGWIMVAVERLPPPGTLANFGFSVALVGAGLGAWTWRPATTADGAVERFGSVLGSALLPMAAVVVSLSLVVRALAEPTGSQTFGLLAVAAIAAAMARQTLLLRERDRFAAREREAADRERDAAQRERAAREEALVALAAHREAESRYRAVVEVFSRLGEQMTAAVDEPALLKAAAAALGRLVPTPRGNILLVNASEDRLTVAVSWGPDAAAAGSAVDVETPVRCLGIRRAAVYVVEDVEDELQLQCPAYARANGAVACVPMVALGRTVGVIHLERAVPEGFDRDAQRQASRVAEQVALAVANSRLIASMERMALTDALTGLHNARFFDPFLERELEEATRDRRPLGLIAIDLDDFKQFNDTYGHPAGDQALRAFAAVARATLRASDVIARYGGEEFTVAVRGADAAAARLVAEKLRQAVAELVVPVGSGLTAALTASFGVASTADHGVDRTTLMRVADQALYRAKMTGRNRVEVAQPPLT